MKNVAIVLAGVVGGMTGIEAASISFNATVTGGLMNETDVAGVNGVAYWNNMVNPVLSTAGSLSGDIQSGIRDSEGNVLATTVVWLGNGVAVAGGSGNNHQRFFTSEWDPFGSSAGTSMIFEVQNIPYAVYDVYFYVQDAGNAAHGVRGGSVDANGTVKSIRMYELDSSILGGPYNYVEADSSDPFDSATTPQGTYLKLEGITGSTLELVMSAGASSDGTPRLRISGFQIVEVIPEPSTSALMMGLLLGSLLRRRR